MFLVNLALSLGLYADFSQPRRPSTALPIWDLLALCAVDLGGADLADEPLQAFLSQLAGRAPGEQAGAAFAPPRSWCMPPAWLAAFAADRRAWRWHDDGQRLRVRHPAGFTVLDLPRARPSGQLACAMAPYRSRQRRVLLPMTHTAEGPPLAGLAQWRAWLMPYLAQRLALAMGERDAARAARQVFAVPARLELSPARLDVHMALADLPLAVRLAGLDRDPGWLPAAGVDMRFHFAASDARRP